MTTMPLLVLAIFVALASIAAAAGLLLRDLLFRRRMAVDRRLGTPADSGELGLASEMPGFDNTPTLNPVRRITRWFVRLVYESGVEMPPEAAQLLVLLCGLLVGGSLFVLFQDELLPAILGMVVGMAIPIFYFIYRRANRLRIMQEQLPDALDLLVRAVRAGESLDQAIELVGTETAEPLGSEFRRCAAQMHMGLSLHAAVRLLAQRVSLMEVRIFATTVMVHRQTGGNLALTLERVANVVRDRISYRRRFRAATAGGRFATIMIVLLGILAFGYMLFFEPEYLNAFFAEPIGWMVLSAAVVLQLIGLVWVASLLRVDY